MAQRSILSMFKKTNVQDTICRPGKPIDTLSKSLTADPTFNRLGEPVQDTSANLLWWPAAAQLTRIYVRGVPTMAEFMQ